MFFKALSVIVLKYGENMTVGVVSSKSSETVHSNGVSRANMISMMVKTHLLEGGDENVVADVFHQKGKLFFARHVIADYLSDSEVDRMLFVQLNDPSVLKKY